MINRLGIHRRLDGTAHGTILPMYVMWKGTWTKVGEGTYDARNQIVDVVLNADDEAAKVFVDNLGHGSLRGLSMEDPVTHNID